MPISPTWDPDSRTWMLTVIETFTLEEISDLLEKTDWQGGIRYLWDLRDLVKGPDSSGELQQAAALVKRGRELWAGSHVAVVVSREFDFGIARMFQAFADGFDVTYRIFRDRQSATDWLTASSSS